MFSYFYTFFLFINLFLFKINSKYFFFVFIRQVTVTFVTQEGEEQTVVAKKGQSLLDVAHANNIELEGACEGSLACSTCHVVVDPEFYAKLPEPRDEENDMLDLAFGLTETYNF